jgi:hypothetical protein
MSITANWNSYCTWIFCSSILDDLVILRIIIRTERFAADSRVTTQAPNRGNKSQIIRLAFIEPLNAHLRYSI